MTFTKNIALAFTALLLVAGSAKADDSLEFDLDSITDADNIVLEVDFDIDVEALENETDDGLMAGDGDNLEEAISACFRRFGYRGGYSHRSWGCYSHYRCYRPVYRSYCHHYSYCRPIYNYCAPIYRSYWGCH